MTSPTLAGLAIRGLTFVPDEYHLVIGLFVRHGPDL
jgi:hypothetical protein